jgi:hypothetical protein
MVDTITRTNIVKLFEQTVFTDKKLSGLLHFGDLSGFETTLSQVFQDFYNKVAEYFITEASTSVAFCHRLKQEATRLGLKKIRIATGHYVHFSSYYAEKAPKEYTDSRFVCHQFFKSIGNASPVYASRVTQMSVITPSFAVGKAVLDNFNCENETEQNRQLSLEIGHKALSQRVQNMLLPNETLAGKRVLIGIDGGRTRIREWDEVTDEPIGDESAPISSYGTFDTPWKEPKLLVISSIDDEGKVNRKELPIYDVCFGDDELFELLADYLAVFKL